MKKLKALAFAAVLVTTLNFSADAQLTKIGYINAETVLMLMPEARAADSLHKQFVNDSIGPEYQNVLENYQFQDSVAKDSTKPKSVRDEAAKRAEEYRYTLLNWQEITNDISQGKQQQLFAPLMQKINEAINAVAKEKGYKYVLSQESFVVAPDADNLLLPVLTKMRIPIPPQLQQQLGGGTGTRP